MQLSVWLVGARKASRSLGESSENVTVSEEKLILDIRLRYRVKSIVTVLQHT